ncbi:MAG TPA: hypothetical protein VFO53_11125, partial [Casimicrobiaceae bacterium]|nr:hypothetical protein [Casimicrobiaceae bacterium]
DDFPRQLAAARIAVPAATFVVTEAAGESEQVQDALAKFALRAPAVAVEEVEANSENSSTNR